MREIAEQQSKLGARQWEVQWCTEGWAAEDSKPVVRPPVLLEKLEYWKKKRKMPLWPALLKFKLRNKSGLRLLAIISLRNHDRISLRRRLPTSKEAGRMIHRLSRCGPNLSAFLVLCHTPLHAYSYTSPLNLHRYAKGINEALPFSTSEAGRHNSFYPTL